MRVMPLCVAAAAPAVVVTCALLLFAGRELAGDTPLSNGGPRNVAEAARMGLAADVLRLVRAGEDPRALWTLRPQISPRTPRLTALEAAVFSGRGPLVALLDRRGFIGTDLETRGHLFCLADDLSLGEVQSVLFADRRPACERGVTLERVRRRR